jgi:hypothetical protein
MLIIIFSYPSWWIREKSEIIIKRKYLLEKVGDTLINKVYRKKEAFI